MINCPKCNFRQPKDQYCANCGVDIFTFKPLPVSKSKTFFESGFFQIFILILVTAISAYFIAKTDRPQNWVKKFSYYKKTNDSTKNNLQKNNTETDSSVEATPADVEIVAPVSANINQFAPAATVAANSSQFFSEIKLTYAEITRQDLTTLVTESQRLGLYQNNLDISAGIYPDYKSKSLTKLKILKTEQKKFFLNKTEALLSGKTFDETSTFVGLQINIGLKSTENQTTQGHLNVAKISRSDKIDLPLEFELQKNALFFVNWKTAMVGFENEPDLLNTPPFQILESQDFLNQKTEFIIMIETVSKP